MARPDRMEACPFCQPGIGESTFAETDGFFAICDIAPILPGHALVIPKRHVESIMDLTDEELARFAVFGRQVTAVVTAAFHATGCDWAVQDRPDAGQTVPHLHLHIIPRRSGDLPDPGEWYTELEKRKLGPKGEATRPRLTPEQVRRTVADLQQAAARLQRQRNGGR